MLTYPLTKTGGVSLYEQLYRRIKDDILTGRLAAGEKLPSKRALAAHLEVSVITVKNAYEQLIAEGTSTAWRSGGTTSALSSVRWRPNVPHHLPQRLRRRAGRWTW